MSFINFETEHFKSCPSRAIQNLTKQKGPTTSEEGLHKVGKPYSMISKSRDCKIMRLKNTISFCGGLDGQDVVRGGSLGRPGYVLSGKIIKLGGYEYIFGSEGDGFGKSRDVTARTY